MTAKRGPGGADRRTRKTVAAHRPRSDHERRQHERISVNLQVNYGSEETFLFAYITDISEMGIFLRTNEPEPPGTHINLRFAPPGEGPLEVRGVVIWINPFRPGDQDNINPGMGVKFVDLSAGQRDRILQLVRTIAYLNKDDGSTRS